MDSHSINQLSTSIRLLSEALSKKHHRPSDKPILKEQPVDNQEQNSPQSKAFEPVKQTPKSQPISSKSSNKDGSSREVSKRSLEAEEEVNRAIDAIIEFNNQENLTHKDKWRIGVGTLRKLTQRGNTVTKRVLKSRANQIKWLQLRW